MPVPTALATVLLRLVTRVRPCADPTAPRHAFELCTLADDGLEEVLSVFEPSDGGFEGADLWLARLHQLLPSAAFDNPRLGRLVWNLSTDPMLSLAADGNGGKSGRSSVDPWPSSPLAIMSPVDEVASPGLQLHSRTLLWPAPLFARSLPFGSSPTVDAPTSDILPLTSYPSHPTAGIPPPTSHLPTDCIWFVPHGGKLVASLLTIADWCGVRACPDGGGCDAAAIALRAASFLVPDASASAAAATGAAPSATTAPAAAPAAAAASAAAASAGASARSSTRTRDPDSTSACGCSVRVDLCCSGAHSWTETHLALLLAALMHNVRVASLCLRDFHFGGPSSVSTRALAAALRHNARLESLELRGCTFDEAALAAWTSAIRSNESLPLRALVLVSSPGLPRCSRSAGGAISHVLRTLHSPLVELELHGCGVTGGALREVLEALTRHDSRFFTLKPLRRLTLNWDANEAVQRALRALLRRATGLELLRLVRADRATSGHGLDDDELGSEAWQGSLAPLDAADAPSTRASSSVALGESTWPRMAIGAPSGFAIACPVPDSSGVADGWFRPSSAWLAGALEALHVRWPALGPHPRARPLLSSTRVSLLPHQSLARAPWWWEASLYPVPYTLLPHQSLARAPWWWEASLYPVPCTRYPAPSPVFGSSPMVVGSRAPLRCLCIDGLVASADEDASLALLRVATRFDKLTQLGVAGMRLSPDALCALVGTLVHNPSREPVAFDCSRNRIGRGGLKLAAVLRGAVSLRSLDAADNDMDAPTVGALATSLQGQPRLRVLSLARNVRTPPRIASSLEPREVLTDGEDR